MVWINFWGLLGDFLHIYSCPLSSWFCKTRQNFTTDTITWVWLCPHSQDKWGRRVILKCQYGTRVIQLSIVRRVIPLLLPFTMDRWNDDKVRWMALTCYSGIVVWVWWQGVRQQWCETTSIGFVTDRPFLPPARLVAMSVMQGGFYQQYEEAIHICMIFLGKDLMVLLLWHCLVTSHMMAKY